MIIKFDVYGIPRGKQRPRMCHINGKTITYTPKQTKDYEKQIKNCYLAITKKFWDKHIPLKMDILAYYPTPKKVNQLFVTVPPDVNNLAKSVCDALNKIAYFDDAQICSLSIKKYYAATPKITVQIEDFRDGD